MERWASPGLAAQAAYFRHLGSAPGADVVEHDGVYAVRTRISSNTENGVVGVRTVSEELVEALVAWLGDMPASWLCSEGAEGNAHALVKAGCRPDNDAWEMRGPVGAVEVKPPDGISIVPV